MTPTPLLPREVVIKVIAALSPENGAFLIGGQALNFWADYFLDSSPALQALAPFTSKDIDFQGTKEAAIQLAEMFDGTVVIPDEDHATPNSAYVAIEISGVKIGIDFLHSIVGLDPNNDRYVVDFEIPLLLEDGVSKSFIVGIHHPIACMITRVVNICYLNRKDAMAYRQLQIAPTVLDCYLNDLIGSYGCCKEVRIIFEDLHYFLRRNMYGKTMHQFAQVDPLYILEKYRDDERLDERYRSNQISAWRNDISKLRLRLG